MSNQLPHKEMIDAYLTGRLSPEDSDRLMQRLEQDPALKEEFLMQKDLVNSLQSFRKQQLKARLNNIEVGSGYSFTSAAGFKFMVGAALVALLGTGSYFAYTQLSEQENVYENQAVELAEERSLRTEEEDFAQKPVAAPQPQAEEIFSPEEPGAAAEQPKETVTSPSKTIIAENTPKQNSTSTKVKQPAATATATEEPKAAKPEVIKPDVLTYFEEKDALSSSPEVEAPADQLANIRSFDTKNIEVTTKADKRYPFHYSFYDNQLHIYGDFSQVPYEVLEVNSGFNTRYYLYHNGKYYELNPNQQQISRLKELKNEKVIGELEITRAEKLNH
jgi:hypothetical protein